MNIGIIGVGIVGSAVKFGLESLGHNVIPHDIKLNTTINDILDTEICYICVPTPIGEEGICDVSVVSEVIKNLSELNYKGIAAIKSTVTPGTTSILQKCYPKLKICFVPEFLRERCAIADFCENHDLLVIGTEDKNVFQTIKKSHGKYPEKTVQVAERS